MSKIKKFLKEFPKWLGLYLGLCGLVFFNLFIFEEAQQQIIFSTWSSKTAGEWYLIKGTIPLLEKINNTSSTINKYFGWINPIGYLAYHAYNQAEVEQIKSLKALVFANSPELFNGEIIEFNFTQSEMIPENEYYIFKNGNISVLSAHDKIPQRITGKVQFINQEIIIDLRKK
jgi:hypothetical protein